MGTKYKYGGDIRYLVENFKAPKLSVPDSPDDDATLSEKEIWKLEMSEHVKIKTQLRENSKNLHSFIWGQCSEYMQSRVKGDHTYDIIKVAYDTIGLIKLIKGATFKFENQKYLQSAVHSAKRKFHFSFRQEI